MINIKEITSKKDLKKFVKFPFQLYKDSKYWIPPIIKQELETFNKEKNPIFKDAEARFFLAYKSGKIVGRIVAIVNWLEVDKQDALALKEEFLRFTKTTDLRVYAAYDEYDIEKQKEEIYFGHDIVIATPGRLSKLYFLNGIHLGEVQLLAIEDADYMGRNNAYNHVLRLSESLNKCQFVIIADELNPKIANYQNSFMSNARIIKQK